MDVTAVFQGLSDAADEIEGLRCFPFMPDSITPPTFYVLELEIAFDQTFQRGVDDFNPITCRLLASRATDKYGQKQLEQYMKGSGALSIKAAIEADRTLGGACDSLQVTGVRGMGQYEHAGITYYGADFLVRVIGRGN